MKSALTEQYPYLGVTKAMLSALEVWEGIGTYDRIKLIDKYGVYPYPVIMPYEIQRPSKEEIITVLAAAYIDGYLITEFKELSQDKRW